MSYTCAIIDDDELAIQILESYLSKFPEFTLVGSAANAMAGKNLLEKNHVDLLFLDVEMPGITGLELLHTLVKRPNVIISSAKKEYAAESFDLQVLDYLVKPVTLQRFSQGIARFLEQTEKEPVPTPIEAIFFNENKKMVKVMTEDILFIEGLKDYIKVVTPTKSVVTKDTLAHIEAKLDASRFFRLHKSFIVALPHIDAYNSTDVEINGTTIPIGRNFKDGFFARMGTVQE